MKTLNIELLALDLAVCDRCGGTLANLKTALKAARPALAAMGIEAVLTETVVVSEDQAERRRFAVSPTIRIEGHDITGAPRETACSSCSDLSGAEESINCRVWPWRGGSYDAAPTGLIVEAILKAAMAPAATTTNPPWKGVPENIRGFLAGRAAQTTSCCSDTNGTCCGTTGSRDTRVQATEACGCVTAEPCRAPSCCQ